MSDSPLIAAMLASMPPYICKCGREMGVPVAVPGGEYGCQPGHCLGFKEPSLPDAVRVERTNATVQLGPVHYSGGVALYDCPCGCGLWTSEPAKLCSCCNEQKPATHWDGLVDACGDCAPGMYGE